eukprot:gene6405-8816_t
MPSRELMNTEFIDKKKNKEFKNKGGKNRGERSNSNSFISNLNAKKAQRLASLARSAEKNQPPIVMSLKPWNLFHNFSSNAIFTTAICDKEGNRMDVVQFFGTARRYIGYDIDLVAVVRPSNNNEDFLKALQKYKVITYEVVAPCFGSDLMHCQFEGLQFNSSINMLRYYIYQYWSLMYAEESIIIISDFLDVFFQGNPFTYRSLEWQGKYEFITYLEAFPNMIIGNNIFNYGWIESCYGPTAADSVKDQIVSCSGTSMGTRNAILGYSYLMTNQLNPKVRIQSVGKEEKGQNKCESIGIDQGFHNWLLYSGALSNYMDVKFYYQGVGAVNVLGGYYGDAKLLNFKLSDWKIVKGVAPNVYVVNWDNSTSPMIHQLDRFIGSTQLHNGDLFSTMAALQNIP